MESMKYAGILHTKFIDMILLNTKYYVARVARGAEELVRHDMVDTDIYSYIAAILYMSQVQRRKLSDYWSTDGTWGDKEVPTLLSRARLVSRDYIIVDRITHVCFSYPIQGSPPSIATSISPPWTLPTLRRTKTEDERTAQHGN